MITMALAGLVAGPMAAATVGSLIAGLDPRRAWDRAHARLRRRAE